MKIIFDLDMDKDFDKSVFENFADAINLERAIVYYRNYLKDEYKKNKDIRNIIDKFNECFGDK